MNGLSKSDKGKLSDTTAGANWAKRNEGTDRTSIATTGSERDVHHLPQFQYFEL